MGRKHRSRKLTDPGKAADFHVNPFSELKLDLPDAPQDSFPKPDKEPAPQHEPDADKRRPLDAEDSKLLQAFSQGGEIGSSVRGLTVSLAIERKGRGGKTVTILRGLQEMDVLEQMELCRELRTHLGTGGRFTEGVLELQGDQRQRAGDWLQTQGYRVKGL